MPTEAPAPPAARPPTPERRPPPPPPRVETPPANNAGRAEVQAANTGIQNPNEAHATLETIAAGVGRLNDKPLSRARALEPRLVEVVKGRHEFRVALTDERVDEMISTDNPPQTQALGFELRIRSLNARIETSRYYKANVDDPLKVAEYEKNIKVLQAKLKEAQDARAGLTLPDGSPVANQMEEWAAITAQLGGDPQLIAKDPVKAYEDVINKAAKKGPKERESFFQKLFDLMGDEVSDEDKKECVDSLRSQFQSEPGVKIHKTESKKFMKNAIRRGGMLALIIALTAKMAMKMESGGQQQQMH